jgi:hypothetical protein
MEKFKEFLKSLGALHDVRIDCLSWMPKEKSLEFHLDDLHGSLEGEPSYPGLKPGVIKLTGITRIIFEMEITEKHLNIYEFSVNNLEPGRMTSTILFWPSGRLTVDFKKADFPELKEI